MTLLKTNPLLTDDIRHLSAAVRTELDRLLHNCRFERDGKDLILSPRNSAKMRMGGRFTHWMERLVNGLYVPWGGFAVDTNLVVDTGLDQIAQNGLSAFIGYIAPFTADVEPAHDLTSAHVIDVLAEFTAYTAANRVSWVKDAYAAQTYVNAGTPAQFIANGADTIRGFFLTSAQNKSAVTGTMVAAARSEVDRPVIATDKINCEYGITLSSI